MFSSSGITEQMLLSIPGIVKEDPKLPEDKILPPPSPRPQNSIFDTDEEKSKVKLRVFMSTAPHSLTCAAENTAQVGLWSSCWFREGIFSIMPRVGLGSSYWVIFRKLPSLPAAQQPESSLMLCQKVLPSKKCSFSTETHP